MPTKLDDVVIRPEPSGWNVHAGKFLPLRSDGGWPLPDLASHDGAHDRAAPAHLPVDRLSLQAQRDDVRAGRDGEARRLVDAADENRRNREHDADRGRLWRGSRVRTGRFRHGSDRRTGTLAPQPSRFQIPGAETETTDDQQHKRGGQTRRGPRKDQQIGAVGRT